MIKSIQELREESPEELTIHDVLAMQILSGILANPHNIISTPQSIKLYAATAAVMADEVLLLRQELSQIKNN